MVAGMKFLKCSFAAGAMLTAAFATPTFAQEGKAVTGDKGVIAMPDLWGIFDGLVEADKFDEIIERFSYFAEQQNRSAEDRAGIYGAVAMACGYKKDNSCFLSHVEKSIAAEPATGHHMAAILFSQAEDKLVPTRSFTWLVENDLNTAMGFKVRDVHGFFDALIKDSQKAKAREILEKFAAAKYMGAEDGVTPESLWVELARMQIVDGDIDPAVLLLKQSIGYTSLAINVWQDRDFAPVWDRLASDSLFEPARMLQSQWDKNKSEAERAKLIGWEAWIGNRLALALALRTQERHDEAEQLLLETLEAIPEYRMSESGVGWIKNVLAYIYEEQGHTDKALDNMAAILSVPDKEKRNLISHLINQSIMQWRQGNFQQAITIADEALDNFAAFTSEHGLVWVKAAKLCALSSMGRPFESIDLWEDLKAKPDVNYAAVTMIALCRNEQDFAAELFVQRLQSETDRSGALDALSQYKWVGPKHGEFRLRERLKTIVKRSDVQVALTQAGRVGDWGFLRDYWGEY